MTRFQAYEAIDNLMRQIDPNASAAERAKGGAEACLIALAAIEGIVPACEHAYQMADHLAAVVVAA